MTTQTPTKAHGLPRLLTSREVMETLGYNDLGSFLAFARAQGLPFIRINARKFAFEEAAVRAWLDRRRVGGEL